MRDIPVFATENGVASLVLQEVPYRKEAYISLQDSQNPEALLRECVDFCVAVGAEKIYAKGHCLLEAYPLHTVVWQMERLKEGLPAVDAVLIPVTDRNMEQWRELYHEKMKNVPNAATMTAARAEDLVEKGTGYFVYLGGELFGIGIAEGDRVETVIAAKPGAGRTVLLALCGVLHSQNIRLEVASENIPARKLYEKSGFVKTAELSRWYRVK